MVDTRTKVAKLLELAKSEEGNPEGELALQRARELFDAGASASGLEPGQIVHMHGIPYIYRGEIWPVGQERPTVQLEAIRIPVRAIRVKVVSQPRPGGSSPWSSAPWTPTTPTTAMPTITVGTVTSPYFSFYSKGDS